MVGRILLVLMRASGEKRYNDYGVEEDVPPTEIASHDVFGVINRKPDQQKEILIPSNKEIVKFAKVGDWYEIKAIVGSGAGNLLIIDDI